MSVEKLIWKEAKGWYGAVADEQGITNLEWSSDKNEIEMLLSNFKGSGKLAEAAGHLKKLREELSLYLSGKLKKFTVPVNPNGTEFQRAVWEDMRKIEFGRTLTYKDLAARHGTAARAVGQVCRKNPVPILIPCHRVLGSGGKLTGFATGLDDKRWLLSHEGIEWKE